MPTQPEGIRGQLMIFYWRDRDYLGWNHRKKIECPMRTGDSAICAGVTLYCDYPEMYRRLDQYLGTNPVCTKSECAALAFVGDEPEPD